MTNKMNTNNKNHVFYGVSLPNNAIEEDNQMNDIQLVFDNKEEALEVVKKWKESRFKAFYNIEDAIVFSKEVVKPEISSDDNKDMKNSEKSLCPFNGLHPRDLTSLRKAIERDDYKTVEQLIWSNPRYLVDISGDDPRLIQEGPRYNSCHIAAKENKYRVLDLILTTVSNEDYLKLLYPFDDNIITKRRTKKLLNSYLITPEKGFCETPLHFGCKFGSYESVSVLLSYPNCGTDRNNKSNKKPKDLICERKGDKSVENKIKKLFEDRFYIPLLRDDLSARFGQPFEPNSTKHMIEDNRLTGLAGPMSPKQAQQLYETLKSPRKCTPKDRKTRLTDSRKGLERVARNVCKDMNINWCEFWPFLNTRIDLTSEEGLNRLETHLRQKYFDLDSYSSKTHSVFKFEEFSDDFQNSLNTLSNDISNLDINCSISSDLFKVTERDVWRDDSEYEPNKPSLSVSVIESENSCDSDSDESFVSARSSPTYLFDFYIHGAKISREDIDAALALQHIIDSDLCLKYQFIQNWFKRVVREEPKHFDCFSNGFRSPLSSTPIKNNNI